MNADDTATNRKDILSAFLTASGRIARRLSLSIARVGRVMPLDEDTVTNLSDEDEESLDAFLYRFTSLVSML